MARRPEGQPPLRDLDATGVAAQVLEFETDLGPRGRQGKALRPFEDDDSRFGEEVFETESLEIVESFYAIEVGVVDLGGVGSAVDMNEREGGAGDFVFGGGAESANDAFGERGLPAAEFAGEQHKYGRVEALGEFPAPLRGFFRRVRDDFLIHAIATPAGVDGARGEWRRRLRWRAGRTRRYFSPRIRRLCRAGRRRGRARASSRRF